MSTDTETTLLPGLAGDSPPTRCMRLRLRLRVARDLSQHPQLQNLRLIALTASSEHPGRELAREAGIERYLIKPVGSQDLDELFT